MHTVSVPHGPDGSVLRRPFPCRSHTTSFHWTDGGRNGLGPFRHVTMLPSRPLDGHLRTFSFPPAFFNPSRPPSHHSQTIRPQRRLPCSLHTLFFIHAVPGAFVINATSL
ncbi:hypothetical protein BGY98DRAFT_664467 [Russula aff. rugulosa BPL654]|nr:hypothetical protein BGY98DRAFT_664467 [Russula aff. rugulosa BPL654]